MSAMEYTLGRTRRGVSQHSTKEHDVKKKLAIALTTASLGLALLGGSAAAAHPEPTTKADCKNGGFREYKVSGMPGAAQRFENQGQCIQFVNTGR